MADKATRYGVERLLRRTLSLRNPFDRRTVAGRTFERLMAGLIAEQNGIILADLPPTRQLLSFHLALVHVWLGIDGAYSLAAEGASLPRQHDRRIAYLNTLARLATALGVGQRASSPDVAALLAAMREPGPSEKRGPRASGGPRKGSEE